MEIIVPTGTICTHKKEVHNILSIASKYCDIAFTQVSIFTTLLFTDGKRPEVDHTVTIHLEVPQKLLNAIAKKGIGPDELGPNACEHITEARAFCAILRAHKKQFPNLGIKAQEVAYIEPKT